MGLHPRPETLELYVMRVLNGESIAAVSREAGIPTRALQVQVLRAQARNAKLTRVNSMMDGSRHRHSRGYQVLEPSGRLRTEEIGQAHARRLKEQQQQRELLLFQDQYVYEIHRDATDDGGRSEQMEVDDTASPSKAQVRGDPTECSADSSCEVADSSEWATESESYPRKRRKTESLSIAPVACM